MSQLDGNNDGDLAKSSLSTSKVMLAAGQIRPELEVLNSAALDLRRQRGLRSWKGVAKNQIPLVLFALIHATVFAHGFFYYYLDDNFVSVRAKMGIGFSIAGAAGLVLHLDLAILLFPVCRNLVSIIRRRLLNNSIDLDDVVSLHKLTSRSMILFACVHTVAYWHGSARQAKQSRNRLLGFLYANLATGPGLSGHLMLLLLIIIAVTSLESFCRTTSKLFWSTHHLYILFLILWSVHGAFCVIKTDRSSSCASMGAFWQYFICGGATYLGERILRELYARHGTPISKVIAHPGNVVEIQLKKRKTKCKVGQYIYLCVPEISALQDFRYFLSSAPEEDYMSVHMMAVTPWAKSLAALVGCDFEQRDDSTVIGIDEKVMNLDVNPSIRKFLPPTYIDGPFGGLPKDIFQYEVAVLIAVGLDVSPFASMLKSIWYRMSGSHQETRLRKVYLFWTCERQNYAVCEWFRTLLVAIEAQDIDHNIEIYTYVLVESMTYTFRIDGITNEKLNSLKVPTKFGHPNWGIIFGAIKGAHHAEKMVCVSPSLDCKNLKIDPMD